MKKSAHLALDLKALLDEKADQFNQPAFIALDPISVPHAFSKKQDIEIAGLLAAIMAWGQRTTIISKANDFLNRMDQAPHDFVQHFKPHDLRRFKGFKHRTFNEIDARYVITFLHHYYQKHESLESAFGVAPTDEDIGPGLINFRRLFFSLENSPRRTQKHISSPERKSACKRMNMYLRWMVRTDRRGVDFGIWKTIAPHQLVCPCDLHVDRVARKLKLIRRKQLDWQTALELTANLKRFDPNDPVKYDFALFGLGVMEKF